MLAARALPYKTPRMVFTRVIELFSRTGLHLSSRTSACKIEWHKENTPEVWSKAVGWLGMAEYLVFRMTGEKSTDPSLASRTMLFGIEDGEWDGKLCGLAGVPQELLPPVYEAGTGPGRLLSSVATRLSVPTDIPVVVVEVADFGICCTASHDITAGQRVAVETLLNCSSCRTCCSLSRGG